MIKARHCDVPRKPNLASMVRFVRVVQVFKRSIDKRSNCRRSRPNLKKLKGPLVADEAYAALQTFAPQLRKKLRLKTGSSDLRPTSNGGDWEEGYQKFRREIDKAVPLSAGTCTDCAADYSLFCDATPVSPKQLVDTARCVDDVQRLESLVHELNLYTEVARRDDVSDQPSRESPGREELLDESWVANLEHLLMRCIWMMMNMFFMLVSNVHDSLVEHQERLSNMFGQGWFFEWPKGRPPLNSTWPWNIKPSLVVLWGVCWMFYNSGGGETGISHDEYQDATVGLSSYRGDYGLVQDFTGALTPATYAQPDYRSLDYVSSHRFSEGQDLAGVASRDLIGSIGLPVTFPNPEVNNIAGAGWHYNNGVEAFAREVSTSSDQWRNVSQQSQSPYNPYQHLQIAPEPQGYQRRQSYLTVPDPNVSLEPSPENISPRQGGLFPRIANEQWQWSSDMSTEGYPSPGVSPNEAESRRKASIADSAITNSSVLHNSTSPMDKDGASRTREGSRNSAGLFQCMHPECATNPPTFKRHCELKKHTDKHSRPYRCQNPMCEKRPGFTYSGGLARHEREVHPKGGERRGHKLCPYLSCNRSSHGQGFTREENLREHVRRRHKVEHDEERDVSGDETQRKRRRASLENESSTAPYSTEAGPLRSDADLHSEVAQLRTEVKRLKTDHDEMRRVISDIRVSLGR
ncbi:MAG: hypothetical protein M4579_002073 [Chaenotheca gracillima]|nr:MAG: hypothetical protein M4579_002073 [Chaenotheca gracillima]